MPSICLVPAGGALTCAPLADPGGVVHGFHLPPVGSVG